MHILSKHTHRHTHLPLSLQRLGNVLTVLHVLFCSALLVCAVVSVSSVYGTHNCAACEPGKYTEEADQTECLSCPPGTYAAVSICMHAEAFNTKNLTESHIQRLTKVLLIHMYVSLHMSFYRAHAQTMKKLYHRIGSCTRTKCTGLWTARRRMIQTQVVKTSTSLYPRDGPWQTTIPIHGPSCRTPGELTKWFLQMDMHTQLLLYMAGNMLVICGVLGTCSCLGRRTWVWIAIRGF
jgi:hypothetical protein